MQQRGYKRKYKPRKEMSLAELKRMVAKGHAISREKHGQSNAKRNWNAHPKERLSNIVKERMAFGRYRAEKKRRRELMESDLGRPLKPFVQRKPFKLRKRKLSKSTISFLEKRKQNRDSFL